LVTFALFVLGGVSQQLDEVPRPLATVVFNSLGYVVAGFILSSLSLFILSLFCWRSLSIVQRAYGLGIFLFNIIIFWPYRLAP
jgi:hypothetical protein